MARKKSSVLDDLVDIAAQLPWKAGVGLAVVAYFILHYFATRAPLSMNPAELKALGKTVGDSVTHGVGTMLASVFQYIVPFAFLVGAFISFSRRRRQSELHAQVATDSAADALEKMSWQEFEGLVAETFRRQGYRVMERGDDGPDGGVDIELHMGSDKYLVQCKHWKSRKVGVATVQELYGVMTAERAVGAFLVASGAFTDEARCFANGRAIELFDARKLCSMIGYIPSAKSALQKNVVLFIDGTWNAPDGEKETNVRQLYEAANNNSQIQVCHYIPGVGSKERLSKGREKSSLIRRAKIYRPLSKLPFQKLFKYPYRWIRQAFGGASGLGTAFNIKEAYAFLCDNYNALSNDKVFIFGFSRGAFAARSLAGFASVVGLLLKDNLEFVEDAYLIYEEGGDSLRLKSFLNEVKQLRQIGGEAQGELPVYFIGVWDTVGALGIPGREIEFPGFKTEYHQVELPWNVTHARHALSLHELRPMFAPLLWNGCSRSGQSLKQVWFAGAHADIGGGYKNNERSLSNVALAWMAEEAEKEGLRLIRNKFESQSYLGMGKVHHQIRKLFLFCVPEVRQALSFPESFPNALNSFSIHSSVLERLKHNESCRYKFLHPSVNWRLLDVDDSTLRLHLLLWAKNNDWAGKLSFARALKNDWWKTATINELRLAQETVRKYVFALDGYKSKNHVATLRALILMLSVGQIDEFRECLLNIVVLFGYLSYAGNLTVCREKIVESLNAINIYALIFDVNPPFPMTRDEREQVVEEMVEGQLVNLHQVFNHLNDEERRNGHALIRHLINELRLFVSDEFCCAIQCCGCFFELDTDRVNFGDYIELSFDELSFPELA